MQLIYSVVLFSAAQHRESAITVHISTLFEILSPHSSFQSTDSSSLCYTYSRSLLVIYFIRSSVYMFIPISQLIPLPFSPSWYLYACSLHLCLYFYFAIVNQNFWNTDIGSKEQGPEAGRTCVAPRSSYETSDSWVSLAEPGFPHLQNEKEGSACLRCPHEGNMRLCPSKCMASYQSSVNDSRPSVIIQKLCSLYFFSSAFKEEKPSYRNYNEMG